jgi:signal peptidase I
MREFLDFTILGITAGAIYAVAASGLVVTYTTSGIFNFAHGAVGMLAAFTYWQLRFEWGWPAPIAIIVVLFILAPLFGALVERVVMRGLQGTSEVTKLVVSVGLLVAMIGLAQVIWDTSVGRDFQGFFGIEGFTVGGVVVTYHKGITIVVAVAVAVGLRAFLFNTRTGVSMRAVVDNRSLAELNGARPNRASMLSWAIGFSLAALAGILVAPILNLNVFALTLLVVSAYAAAVVGRLVSLPWTFVGALILGLAENYAIGYLTGDRLSFFGEGAESWLVGIRLSIPVIMLFIVLLILPQARARGATMTRSRESVPRPELKNALLGSVAFVVGAGFLALLLAGELGWAGDSTWLSYLSRGLGLAIIALVPTNAMAPTILGNHVRSVCPECGQPNFRSLPYSTYASSEPQWMICERFHCVESATAGQEQYAGDRILVAKYLKPQRWDVIVFRFPGDPSTNYVKRLVGLPGETIHIADGAVWADGIKLEPPEALQGIEYLSEDPYMPSRFKIWGAKDNPAVLAGDEFFVLGDFSPQSLDSRYWEQGAPLHNTYAVPESYMVGVVSHIYWPPRRWRAFR